MIRKEFTSNEDAKKYAKKNNLYGTQVYAWNKRVIYFFVKKDENTKFYIICVLFIILGIGGIILTSIVNKFNVFAIYSVSSILICLLFYVVMYFL